MNSSTLFIHDDFLLESRSARSYYHEIAAKLPIIDYHCHINPSEIAESSPYENISRIWITGDPYKHRAMRINGIPEQEITGSDSDKKLFKHWAETLPMALGNPLYHWSRLELKRFFDWDGDLNSGNWEEVWDHCNSVIVNRKLNAADILRQTNTEQLVTSDRLLDGLEVHAELKSAGEGTSVTPSLRGDDVLAFGNPDFFSWLDNLQKSSGIEVTGLELYIAAVTRRLDFFHESGCRVADHSLSDFQFRQIDKSDAYRLFERLLKGEQLNVSEVNLLTGYVLLALGRYYSRRKWVLLLHLNAQRNTSSRLRSLAGSAGGYAGIGNSVDVPSLTSFLDALERESSLPRTVLFTLNPVDNEVLATLTGSYAEDSVPGKIQFGPAWWYNDHKPGMLKQLEALSTHGLLSRFIGMTTDSRSVLSMTRHEYFRRIFCNLLGGWSERGEIPDDEALIENLITRVCYTNARDWLKE